MTLIPMDLVTSAVLKSGLFVGRNRDKTLNLSHPLHGKLCFFEGKEFACCAEELAGEWVLRDQIEITMSDENREGSTEITAMEMLEISTPAEHMLALLMDRDNVSDACDQIWQQYLDGEDVGHLDEAKLAEIESDEELRDEYTPGSFWYTAEKV